MSLTAWETFVEVERLGRISAAAETLGYTQSAVSRQVAALERELGAVLLTREARGVRLTPAGAAVLPHARALVAEAQRARRAAHVAGRRGHVAVGAVPSAAVSHVPEALRRLRNGPTWTLVVDGSASLVERVAAGTLDLAVVTDAPPGLPRVAGVRTRRLRDDPMGVVVPAGHPLGGRRRVRIAELAAATWIEDNPGSEALLQALAARADVVLDVDRSCDDLMTKIALVAAGHGVALAPSSLRRALRPDVVLVGLSGAPRRTVYAVTREGRGDLERLVSSLAAPSALR